MEELLVVLYFVFGGVSIVLFFKVWAMTNNVKHIAAHIAENNKATTVTSLLLSGKKKEAAAAYISEVSRSIAELVEEDNRTGYSDDRKTKGGKAIDGLKSFLRAVGHSDMLPAELTSYEAATKAYNTAFGVD